jgi:transposase
MGRAGACGRSHGAEARVGPGAAADDHHGVGVGHAGAAIARLGAADQATVRDVIHLFNSMGLAALDPRWAGARPRRISDDDTEVIVAAARTRPEKLGLPFTHWSLRTLAAYLAGRDQPARIGRERLRQIPPAHGISFPRTRTGPGRSPPTRTGTPTWIGSST